MQFSWCVLLWAGCVAVGSAGGGDCSTQPLPLLVAANVIHSWLRILSLFFALLRVSGISVNFIPQIAFCLLLP